MPRLFLPTIVGRIGLALLLVSALGLTIAAIFTADPIMVSEDAVTTASYSAARGVAPHRSRLTTAVPLPPAAQRRQRT